MDDLSVGPFSIPASEIEESFSPAGGPGGQHANRSATAVELRFHAAGSRAIPEPERSRILERLGPVVAVVAGESRSQWRNRAVARRRLAERLEAAMRPTKQRQPTRPTRASRQARLESKRRQSEKKRLRRRPQW